MVMDVNSHFAIYSYIESIRCTSEPNIMLYVKHISMKKHTSENLKKKTLEISEIAVIFDMGHYVLAAPSESSINLSLIQY